MKRIVLTGGGTAGHVTPHLAIIPRLKEAGYDIHYVGTPNGIERTMMEKTDGVTYHCVESGKLRRYLDFKNVTDFFKVIRAGSYPFPSSVEPPNAASPSSATKAT